jgi:hypothetical protein
VDRSKLLKEEPDDGPGSERRSSHACSDGLDGRTVGTAGGGKVRRRNLDGDPVDCAARLGETTARAQGRRRGPSLDAHEAFIVGLIEERPDLDPQRLVFIDETGLPIRMARLRGRAGLPHGPWKTTTFAGALRLGGMMGASSGQLVWKTSRGTPRRCKVVTCGPALGFRNPKPTHPG